MNIVDKLLLGGKYLNSSTEVTKDIMDFGDSLQAFLKLLEDPEFVKKHCDPMDLIEVMIYMKEFTDNIKPFVIKYGIVPNLIKPEDD